MITNNIPLLIHSLLESVLLRLIIINENYKNF